MHKYIKQIGRIALWLLLVTCLGLVGSPVMAQAPVGQAARIDATTFDAFYVDDVLRVKFVDTMPLRIRNGRPAAISARMEPDALNRMDAVTAGAVWQPLHDVDEAALDALRREGEAATGQALPDLNSYMRLVLPPEADVQRVRQELAALDIVEWIDFMPKPEISADVPNFVNAGAITGNLAADRYQRYLDPAPVGVDARWAWLGSNSSGTGIRLCDVEKNVNANHADLPRIKILSPEPDPLYDNNHGTAVMGIMAGENNRFGVKGIAYNADLYFSATTSVKGFNVAAAITRCANAVRAGDVIIIEVQARGPNTKPAEDRAWSAEGLVPVEWDKANYDAIKVAVAAGRIVVEAGSNGAEDLDASEYQTGNGGHHPFKPENDSGAILVGAGYSPYEDDEAPRSPSWFTNYGQTMDVQGWGDGIVTTGYGDLHPGDADENERNLWFKRSFGGTSGATPIVAGAAAVLQDTFKAVNGRVATPAEIKQLLRSTGTPQQGAQNIGPLPDLRAAILQIYEDAGVMPSLAAPTIIPAGGTYAMPLEVTIGYGSGQNQSNTQIRYTLDGSEPTEDSFIFIPSQGDTLYLNYGATVRARAFVRDNTLNRTFESPVATATYASSTPKVATPNIAPAAGTYNQGQQFTLSTTTPGATIRYRTDGRAPSFFYPGTEYTGPITLAPGSYEIVARGYKDGYYKSDAAYSGEIIINTIQLPEPTLYPNSGQFTGELTVYMGSTVLGAEIRYTLDGSNPSATSPRFEEPLTLIPSEASETYTIKARVFLAPYTPSNTTEATYSVIRQLDPPQIGAEQAPNSSEATITMSAGAPNATIRYTTNGAEPTSYSTLYTGPFALGPGLYTVKAKAFQGNAQPSVTTSLEVAVANNSEPITDPVIVPFSTQTHVAPFTVTMRTDTPDAIIRYTFTTDGSLAPDPTPPNAGGAQTYTEPILIDVNGQYRFKAQAFKSNGVGGFNSSNVIGTGTLTLTDPLGAATVPTIDPPGGTFTDTVNIRLSSAPNEVFFYTLDGSEPVLVPPVTPPSQQANAASVITLDSPATLTARAYRVFFSSSTATSAEFNFICATPTTTPGGTYTDSVDVSLTTTTPEAQIRYTLDGSEPTSDSTLYENPIPLSQTTTLKTKCFRADFTPSATATALYVIEPAPETPVVTDQPEDQSADAGQDLTLTVSASGVMTETTVFQWQFNGSDIAGETEPTLDIPSAQSVNAGDYRVIIRDEGGEAISQSATISINQAAVADLTVEQDGPTVLGEPTNFAASVAVGSDVAYTWDFGDGAVGSGSNPSHTYADVGAYSVSVTATNAVNSLTAETTVQVVAEAQAIQGLDAAYDGPTSRGAPTTFFATVNQGTNVVYGWDFGDGVFGAGPRVVHTYATPGTYSVVVTASNTLGSTSRTLDAIVLGSPGELNPRSFLPLIRR